MASTPSRTEALARERLGLLARALTSDVGSEMNEPCRTAPCSLRSPAPPWGARTLRRSVLPVLAVLVLDCHQQKPDLNPAAETLSAKGTSDKARTRRTTAKMARSLFGEAGCDLVSGEYKTLSDANAAERKHGNPDGAKGDGPYEWLTGPKNELLKRTYVRMHSRQTYAYGVAFHLTAKIR